jgi:hypothetical protein
MKDAIAGRPLAACEATHDTSAEPSKMWLTDLVSTVVS